MQKSIWRAFDLTLHRFKNFCRMKLYFYSCSPMNNLSKSRLLKNIFLERRFMFWKQVWRNLKRQRRYFLMKQVRLLRCRPTTRIKKIVCRHIQKSIPTCASWLTTPKTEDWCLRLRKEDFVSDSQSLTALWRFTAFYWTCKKNNPTDRAYTGDSSRVRWKNCCVKAQED